MSDSAAGKGVYDGAMLASIAPLAPVRWDDAGNKVVTVGAGELVGMYAMPTCAVPPYAVGGPFGVLEASECGGVIVVTLDTPKFLFSCYAHECRFTKTKGDEK